MNPQTYTIYITDTYGESISATIRQADIEQVLKQTSEMKKRWENQIQNKHRLYYPKRRKFRWKFWSKKKTELKKSFSWEVLELHLNEELLTEYLCTDLSLKFREVRMKLLNELKNTTEKLQSALLHGILVNLRVYNKSQELDRAYHLLIGISKELLEVAPLATWMQS